MNSNKGFSFVEIIIVVAIMAIASAALAPQIIKHIEKSRVSTDLQTCDTIKSCVNTAFTNNEVWSDMSYYRKGIFIVYIRMSDDGSKMLIQGLKDGDDSATELRDNIANLENPKQAGMNSYMVEVEALEHKENGQTSYSIGKIHVQTTDYHFEDNSDAAIYK